MSLLNPPARAALTERPFRTAARIAATYFLRLHPLTREVRLDFDEGRSIFIADLRTSLGLGMYRYGYSDPELDLVRHLLKPGDVFVDGGANVGLYSLVAAARVGQFGKVISFEPAIDTRRRLVGNCSANAYPWIEIRPEALGHEKGFAQFISFDGNRSGVSSFAPESSSFGKKVEVVVTTLDLALEGLDLKSLRLIKLDLEGAELKALQGSLTVLKNSNTDIFIEIEPSHLQRQGSSAEEVFHFFDSLGFRPYQLQSSEKGRCRLAPPDLLSKTSPNYLMTRDPERLRKAGIEL